MPGKLFATLIVRVATKKSLDQNEHKIKITKKIIALTCYKRHQEGKNII